MFVFDDEVEEHERQQQKWLPLRMREQIKRALDRRFEVFEAKGNTEELRERIRNQAVDLMVELVAEHMEQITVEVKSSKKGSFDIVIRGPERLLKGPFGAFMAYATGVPDPAYVIAKARRERTTFDKSTDPWSVNISKVWEVDVTMIVEGLDGSDPPTLSITEGGVTGHEAIYLYPHDVKQVCSNGWWACAGTPDRWDGLFVSAEEMRRVFDAYGVLGKMGLE